MLAAMSRRRSPPFLSSSERAYHKVFSAYLAEEYSKKIRSLMLMPLPRFPRTRSNHYSTLWECRNWLILSKSIDETLHTFWHHYSHPKKFTVNFQLKINVEDYILIHYIMFKWDIFVDFQTLWFLRPLKRKQESIIGFPRFCLHFSKTPSRSCS